MSIRVVIIEDHPLVTKAIAQELDIQSDIEVVGKADHGCKLMTLVRETSPDVVILDLGLEERFDPISTIQRLRCQHPEVQILVLTGQESAIQMQQIANLGVLGYVLKSDSLSLQLVESVRTVHEGKRFFSPTVIEKLIAMGTNGLSDQELSVLRFVAEGLSSAAIAQKMGLSEQTISNYLTSIYWKLDVADDTLNSRVAAVNKAKKLGIV